MMPCNVPLHGAALDTVWVRTSVFRLKSKPGSKLDGFVSPMNSGSNVVETFLNRDWILLAATRSQARYVTTCAGPPIALEGLAVEQILAWGDLGAWRDGERLPASFCRCGCRIDREIGVSDGTTIVEVRFRLTVFMMGRAAVGDLQ